jgi:nucleoside-diphosphate kinase
MLKPDIINRNLIGKVIRELETKGFKIIAMEMKKLHKSELEEFYKDHKERFFFKDMVSRLESSPVVGIILEIHNQNAVTHLREIMGATNPMQAQEGTIRKLYGISLDDNSIHGSDSFENVQREAKIFFNK